MEKSKIKKEIPGMGNKELMDQMNKLMSVTRAKTDQMVLDSVTVILSSIVKGSSTHAKIIFSENEIEKLKNILFNILNKYDG